MTPQGPPRSRRLALRVLIVLALTIVAAGSLAAQPLTSTIQPVDTPLARTEMLDVPDIARSADGSYLVVWADANGAFLRTFDSAGNVLAPRTVVAHETGKVFGRGRAAALPDGNYVVAWVQTTAPARLYAALFDRLGSPLGVVNDLGSVDADPRSAEYTDSARPAALAVDAAGVISVAWTQGGHVRLDRFVGTVAAAGGALARIGTSDLGAGYGPSLAAWPGGLVLAWMRSPNRYWVDPSQIVVRWLGLDGVPRAGEHTVDFFSLFAPLSPFAAQSIDPVAVAVDPSGRAVVVWHDIVWPSEIERLRAQRFAADGTPLGDPFELVSRPEAPYFAFLLSDVAARPDGAFLVATTEVRNQGYCASPPGPIDPLPPWPACSLVAADLDAVVRGYRTDGTFLAEIPLGVTVAQELTGGVVPTTDGWLAALEGLTVDVARLAPAPPCGGEALCLGGRFRVEATWGTASATGAAHPLDVTGGTGAFWFFGPTNVELLVKVLDGRGVNGKFWFFYAALSDVAFDLVVTDTLTGEVKRYHNPQGTLASRADVDAFDGVEEPATPASALSVVAPASGEATASATGAEGCGTTTLCLQDHRFVVSARWRVPDGGEGVATPLPWSGDTGAFWFFAEHNLELLVKVLDGRGVNGRFWVFFASTSDVEFDLEVLDTATGQRRTYHNVQGTMASRADVDAF